MQNQSDSKKIYKPKVYRIVLNIIYGVLAMLVLAYLLTYFINNINIIILILILFLIIYFKWVIYNTYIIIYIDNNHLIYKKRKEKKEFDIEKCSFNAKITSSTGDNECTLNIIDEQGNSHWLDCELIGYSNFMNLLNDLKIVGDNANPIKIKTLKKGVKK